MGKYSIRVIIYNLFLFIYFVCTGEADVSPSKYEVFNYLGTRTPYRFTQNLNVSKIRFPGCQDKKIWMVVRHGTRLPSVKDAEAMNTTLKELRNQILENYKDGKGAISAEQIKLFQNWKCYNDTVVKKTLTSEGEEEMTLLAERTKKRFPGAVSDSYKKDSFIFQFTSTDRTEQSARYFALGLFDKKQLKKIHFESTEENDITLRFYLHCDKWVKSVKKNSVTYNERQLFGRSKIMEKTLKSVSMRLGFENVLSLENVQLMYKICGYETAWNKHVLSPWCLGFDKRSAQVLEYDFDLKDYWLNGYGHELSYRTACLTVKTMFDQFSNQTSPKSAFYFFHSGSLLKILSHLELYKTEHHLTADNMDVDRVWRTSTIDGFGSNLAFVLYNCAGVDYVVALHQERIIKMPMCDKELCPLRRLQKHFKDTINNCHYQSMCKLDRDDL